MKEGRKAAMVPSSGGALGQVLGSISSALYVGGAKGSNSEKGAFGEVRE